MPLEGHKRISRRSRARIRALAIPLGMLAFTLPAGPAMARDDVVRSFDGTPIVVSWFHAKGLKPGERAPTVLVGHGWGGSRYKASESSSGAGESLGPKPLRRAGYNVLTWDARGFGQSGGTVHVDSPRWEVRDVEKLISYVARRQTAQLDGPGDPRVGMAGGSYGGGIQLNTAASDHRVDAIIPGISWHSLLTSLFKHGAVKGGWGSLLYGVGLGTSLAGGVLGPAGLQSGTLDPHITSAFVNGLVLANPSDSDRRFFLTRGPRHRVWHIQAPTLLVQGTADTLFTLSEATRNFRILRRHGVPAKMIWFCGGHGECTTSGAAPLGIPADQGRYLQTTELAWFDRYLKGEQAASTGPLFRWFADDGKLRSSSGYPLRPAGSLRGRGSGNLPLSVGDTSGLPYAAQPSPLGIHVPIAAPKRGASLLGAPRLRVEYSGTAAPASTFVYAQLVDLDRGLVVGNQVTPVPLVLDGQRRTARLRLERIAARAHRGSRYELQLAAGTNVYEPQRSAGDVDFSRISIGLPRAAPITR